VDRNMDAIRQIVIAVKDSDSPVKEVAGMPPDIFKFNAMLLIEAGLAKGLYEESTRSRSPVPSIALIGRLTWAGFEFADLAKDGKVWEKAKKFILKTTGSYAFEILFEYLKQEARTTFGLNGVS